MVDSNTQITCLTPSNPAGTYDVVVTNYLDSQSATLINGYTYNPIPSNICFPANTPVKTDQGLIAIYKIDPNIHTIHNKPIIDITKTVTQDKYLIEFKKDSLGKNYPSENTVMTQNHKILYQGQMLKAKTFLTDEFENVRKVKYNGEILYNVLLEDYSQMNINNLICETLHPNNLIAKLYTKQCKRSTESRDKIIELLKIFGDKENK